MAFPDARKDDLDPESYLIPSEESVPRNCLTAQSEEQVETDLPHVWDSLSSTAMEFIKDERMDIDEVGSHFTAAPNLRVGQHSDCYTLKHVARRKQVCIAQFRCLRRLLINNELELYWQTEELAGDKGKVGTLPVLVQCWKRQLEESIGELEDGSEEQSERESCSLESQSLFGTATNSFPAVGFVRKWKDIPLSFELKGRKEESKHPWTKDREVSTQFQYMNLERMSATLCKLGIRLEEQSLQSLEPIQELSGNANKRRSVVKLDSDSTKKRCLPSNHRLPEWKQVFETVATVSEKVSRPASKRPGTAIDADSRKKRCVEAQVTICSPCAEARILQQPSL